MRQVATKRPSRASSKMMVAFSRSEIEQLHITLVSYTVSETQKYGLTVWISASILIDGIRTRTL
jgi:hypothetical protein